MPRYRLTLEYDGSQLVGWQRQTNGPSVQQHLEEAIQKFCGQTVLAHAAGRTDAGVHALGQVAHIDLVGEMATDTLREAVNYHLKPQPIAILEAVAAGPSFHARFSATLRAYRYRIVNRRAPLTLERGRAWLVTRPLDTVAMHEAAQGLVGRHDFTSFRAGQCQAKSPVKTLDRLEVERAGEEVAIVAEARSFLHHQVRNMVGSLRLVGEGKWTAHDLAKALAARDRAAAGATAPPDGLYLTRVEYGVALAADAGGEAVDQDA
ncbi:MAG: tRNA pseudouridine(38-40) synthase TruA [Proteobacteria bacterium]|nr:tRNA pseudouridine(38-40) synthase TruA [Pseudomonadota bacterium]MBI3499673.1 tRNA pseudouridine(38-40) synthase TruA [Pseudomonadota bacterium]